MNREKVMDILQEICRDIFDSENLIITNEFSAKDINAWDSLNHLNLISSVEEEFNIKFDFDEITSFKNIGDIIDSVKNKM
jgi:acyl carrier protein